MNHAPNQQTMFCPSCGCQIYSDAYVCPNCGVLNPLHEQNFIINYTQEHSNVKSKNKWVALLLCFFLGFFGAHKFYEGKHRLGVVYCFTGGLFGIGVMIDIFKLLCKPNPYYV